MPCPNCFTYQERDPVPVVQEAGWDPGLVWTCGENLTPHWDLSIQPMASPYTSYT